MFKFLRVLSFVVLIVAFSAGSVSAYEYFLKEVEVFDDGEVVRFRTAKETLGEAFEEQGIALQEKDVVSVPLDSKIINGLNVDIVRAINITVVINKEEHKMTVEKDTHARVLEKDLPQLDNSEYIYDGKYSVPLIDGQVVVYKIKSKETSTVKESIPFETERQNDDTIFEGKEEVFFEGEEGEKLLSTEITYIDGVLQEEKFLGEEIIKEPKNKIIKVGTKKENVVTTEAGLFKYKEVKTMRATAYTNGITETGKAPGDPGYGITRSGMVARVGVVAVDPRVIPLHTKLYIEGYGYAIAGDTGGAIKGNKIDLFFNTMREVNNFGVQQLKVYILE